MVRRQILREMVKSNIKEFHDLNAFFLFLLKIAIFIFGIWYFFKEVLKGINFEFRNYLIIIGVITFVYSALYIYSSFLQNRKIKFLYTLPISIDEIFLSIMYELNINIFVTKFFPLLVGMSLHLLLDKQTSYYTIIQNIIVGYFVFLIFADMAFIIVLYLILKKKKTCILHGTVTLIGFIFIRSMYDHPIIGILITCVLLFYVYYIFNKNYSLLNIFIKEKQFAVRNYLLREFRMFFNDKILVSNVIFTTIIGIFFVINLIINDVKNYMTIGIMLVAPLLSTTTLFLYSYEGKRISLLKSLPLSNKRIFIVKFAVSISITLPICFILSFILFKYNLIDFKFQFFYLLSAVFISIQKVLMDINKPYLAYQHTEELLRSSERYKRYLVILVIYIPLLLYGTFVSFEILLIISVCVNIIIMFKLILNTSGFTCRRRN